MAVSAHIECAAVKQQAPGVAGAVRKPTRCCPCTGVSEGPSVGLVTDILVVSLLCRKSANVAVVAVGFAELNGVLLSWP